jgi:hypothetical protein
MASKQREKPVAQIGTLVLHYDEYRPIVFGLRSLTTDAPKKGHGDGGMSLPRPATSPTNNRTDASHFNTDNIKTATICPKEDDW